MQLIDLERDNAPLYQCGWQASSAEQKGSYIKTLKTEIAHALEGKLQC